MAMRKSERRKNLGKQRFHQVDIARLYCRQKDDPPGFDVRFINDDIGEGVFTTQKFQCGDFLLEYKGDLIRNFEEALAREQEYADTDLGSFLYFFKYKSRKMCIDATHDLFWQGRMVNDAEKNSPMQNSVMKIVELDGNPHLCLFASRDIESDEELRFDYGVPNLPWRKEKKLCKGPEAVNEVLCNAGDNKEGEEDGERTDTYFSNSIEDQGPEAQNEVLRKMGDNKEGEENGERTDKYFPNRTNVQGPEAVNKVMRNVGDNKEGEEDGERTDAYFSNSINEQGPEALNEVVRKVGDNKEVEKDGERTDTYFLNRINVQGPEAVNEVLCNAGDNKEGEEDGERTDTYFSNSIEDQGPEALNEVVRKVGDNKEVEKDGERTDTYFLNRINVQGPEAVKEVVRNVDDNKDSEAVDVSGDGDQDKRYHALDCRHDLSHHNHHNGHYNDDDDDNVASPMSEDEGNEDDDSECIPPSTDEDGVETDSESIVIHIGKYDMLGQKYETNVEDGAATTFADDPMSGDEGNEDDDSDYIPPSTDEDEEETDDENQNIEFKRYDDCVEDNAAAAPVNDVLCEGDNDTRKKTDSGECVELRGNSNTLQHLDESYRRQLMNVTVPSYMKKENGSRDYRKINHCLYCKRSYTSKIAPHYLSIHSNEKLVKQIILSEPGSEKRKTLLIELENRGNYAHNTKVIEAGEGQLVVARRPTSEKTCKYTAADFLPCEYCLGFYLKDTLWLHSNKCPLKPQGKQPSTKNVCRDAKVMLSPFLKELTEEDAKLELFFSGMKETNANPGIPILCKNDTLIQEFATSMLHRLGGENEQRVKDLDNARTKVRTVGRLLKKLHQSSDDRSPLSEFITGKNFLKVVDATKSLSLECDSPQLALTLGHYIKHIALLKGSLGIQTENEKLVNEASGFKKLYNAHWNNRVSSVAKRRQKIRHINKPSTVPLTSDLLTITDWIKNELACMTKMKSPNRTHWERAARLLMIRIALFNKRRISEVSEIKVSDIELMNMNDEIDSEIYNALDMSEKILSNRMKVIEVRGKSTRGLRKVCVLLTPDMIDALKYLQMNRKSTSKFLFCRQSDNTPMDGCSVMRMVTAECPGLKEPNRIRTRGMRRYLATTTQILDMTDAELKMVADHMGHNVNIHMDVYRLQSSIIEKTKVARVLMAMENGNISKYQGKNLQDILLEDIAEPVSFDDGWSMGTPGTSTDTAISSTKHFTDAEADSDGEIHLSEQSDDDQTNTSGKPAETKSPEQHLKRKIETQTSVSNCKIARTRWMTPEKNVFRQTLYSNILSKEMPTGEKLKALSKQLPGRSVPQIRTRMHNIITGKLKKY